MIFTLLLLSILGIPMEGISQEEGFPKECTSECSSTECVEEASPMEFTIENAIPYVLMHNRQIISAYEGLAKIGINLATAEADFDVQFVPNGKLGYGLGGTLGTGADYAAGLVISKSTRFGTHIGIVPSFFRASKEHHSVVRVNITQPLLRGIGTEYTLAGIRAIEFASRSALRAFYLQQVNLIMRTLTALYEIKKSNEFLRLNEESLCRLRKVACAARLKEKMGLGDSIDLLRAEMELKSAEDMYNAAQERLKDAEDLFKDLMALPPETQIAVDVPLIFHESPLQLEEGIETALKNRVEIEQAKEAIQEAMRLAWLAERNLLPDLNLVAGYRNGGSHASFIGSWTNHRENIWSVELTSTTDLYQTAAKANLEVSEINVTAAKRGEEQTRDAIVTEVKKGFRSLEKVRQRLDLLKEQIVSAEKELRLSVIKCNHGYVNNLDVLQAEKGLRSIQQAILQTVIEQILGEYQLLASIGMLADKPRQIGCP